MPTLYGRFTRELDDKGWSSEPSGSGMRFRRDRCVSALAPGEDVTIWTVFPTPPQLRPGVVTNPYPIPLATYTLMQTNDDVDVATHVADRNGALSKQPFFRGGIQAAFDRLVAVSTDAVAAFVQKIERP